MHTLTMPTGNNCVPQAILDVTEWWEQTIKEHTRTRKKPQEIPHVPCRTLRCTIKVQCNLLSPFDNITTNHHHQVHNDVASQSVDPHHHQLNTLNTTKPPSDFPSSICARNDRLALFHRSKRTEPTHKSKCPSHVQTRAATMCSIE